MAADFTREPKLNLKIKTISVTAVVIIAIALLFWSIGYYKQRAMINEAIAQEGERIDRQIEHSLYQLQRHLADLAFFVRSQKAIRDAMASHDHAPFLPMLSLSMTLPSVVSLLLRSFTSFHPKIIH
ncbi:MAG: hypothetical protein K6347_02540 [Campylobacterales bacterium]